MTGTNCDLFTHKSSRSYLNHLVFDKGSLPLVWFDFTLIWLGIRNHRKGDKH
jgi:hypothetical protein